MLPPPLRQEEDQQLLLRLNEGHEAAKQRLLAFLGKRGYAYGGTTPAGNPRKYWTYDFLRWLDKVRPKDDGGVRTLAALRNEVEAADETREALLAEYRAAVAAGPLSAAVEALQSIKASAIAQAAAISAEDVPRNF